MPLYRVDIQANFLVNATTRDVVANRVRRMFRRWPIRPERLRVGRRSSNERRGAT